MKHDIEYFKPRAKLLRYKAELECELVRVKAALEDAKETRAFRYNNFIGIGMYPILKRPPKEI
jgi:hypothetical protein